ncbi:MAG: hypothetical protein ABI970_09105 [Chloroflexota bacterium]
MPISSQSALRRMPREYNIVERRYLEPPNIAGRYSSIKTCCGIELVAPFDECQEEDNDCETCATKVEEQ